MAKPKTETINTDVSGAIAEGCSQLAELGSEMQDWYDNMPENMQSSDRADRIQEAASSLEEAGCEPDVPSALEGVAVVVVQPTAQAKSRAVRRERALMYLQAVHDVLDGIADGSDEGWDDDSRDEAGELRDAVQDLIDTAESVEFPGMRS